ncbi:hypothetical protein DKX38_015058 [Salix brachista]|uniref:Uncharacterized protein n=1 Tax=Salix brachista TaxID=2182728 RepID=A0A5N5L459_9ROSI|nr:hypothetical protein DKX38_015058 [Salix brachista]
MVFGSVSSLKLEVLKDVESLMAAAENLSVIGVSGTLWSALIDEVKWLRKTLISLPSNIERCKLSDAEAVLAESQVFKFYVSLLYPEVFL